MSRAPRSSKGSAALSPSAFRSLLWQGSVPLCFSIAPSERGSASSQSSVDSYYLQAPRISYLPLLLPEIRKNLIDLVLDESASLTLREDALWFDLDGVPLRWCALVVTWTVGYKVVLMPFCSAQALAYRFTLRLPYSALALDASRRQRQSDDAFEYHRALAFAA